MDAAVIFDGLNPEQRRAVETVRGPVCILAGAGSGKTTTITRRIANQVAAGAFSADQILAVTFTDKAAREMRSRLEDLGAGGVRARTFHSAAFAQLRWFRGEPPGRILASKALMLRQIGNTLPMPYKFRPAVDLATEVEWAKNRRLTPESYRRGLNGHESPIPDDLMARVFREYERRKEASGALDFEDLLGLAIKLLEDEPEALAQVRDRYRAFTGATPDYLLELPKRFPNATVVRLEANYRSTPQVLGLANRLVPKLGGAEKQLRETHAPGPEPELRGFDGGDAEAKFVVERVRELHAAGTPLEEMAVLIRLNARSVDFEEAFSDAEIPFQGAALLTRDAARQLLKGLTGSTSRSVAYEVRRLAREHGWEEAPPKDLGERELTRQNDLTRLVRLAEEFDGDTVDGFVEHLRARFAHGAQGGVHLLTLHRAKGLEFEAVFLPRVEEKELPCKPALRNSAAIAEERRLLYVGLTRPKRRLALTWTQRPSRFLSELGIEALPKRRERRDEAELPPQYATLKQWRLKRARADEIPAYVVFHNSTLEEIAERRPRTISELAAVPGVGPAKLERYGREVLAALAKSA